MPNLLRKGWMCVDEIIGSISLTRHSRCLLMSLATCDRVSGLPSPRQFQMRLGIIKLMSGRTRSGSSGIRRSSRRPTH